MIITSSIKKITHQPESRDGLLVTENLQSFYKNWTNSSLIKQYFKTYSSNKIFKLPYHLANDKPFVKELLIQNKLMTYIDNNGGIYLPDFLKHLPKSIREDYEIMKIAMQDNGQCSSYLGPKLQDDKKFFLDILNFYKSLSSKELAKRHVKFITNDMDLSLIVDKQINRLLCKIGARLNFQEINFENLSHQDIKKVVQTNRSDIGYEPLNMKTLFSFQSDPQVASIILDGWIPGSSKRRELFRALPRNLRNNEAFVKSELNKDINLYSALTQSLKLNPLIYFHALNKNPDLIFSAISCGNSKFKRTFQLIKKINFQILDIDLEKKQKISNKYIQGFKNADIFMLAKLKEHICKPFDLNEVRKVSEDLAHFRFSRNYSKKKFLSYLNQANQQNYPVLQKMPSIDRLYLNISYRLKTDHQVIRGLIFHHSKNWHWRSLDTFYDSLENPNIYWKEMLCQKTNVEINHLPSEILKKIDLTKNLFLKRAIQSNTDHLELWKRMRLSDQKKFCYQKLLIRNSNRFNASSLLEIFINNSFKFDISKSNLLALTAMFYDIHEPSENYLYNRKFKAQEIKEEFLIERLKNNIDTFDSISSLDLLRIKNTLKKFILKNSCFARKMVDKNYGPPPINYSSKRHLRFSHLPACLKSDKAVVAQLIQFKISLFKYLPSNLKHDPEILKLVLLFKPSYITKCNIDELYPSKASLSALPVVTKKAIKNHMIKAHCTEEDLFCKANFINRVNALLGI